jgi:NAD(P)-dependent dehydrogenase (short-subunit alcohol dehydrogenase family)
MASILITGCSAGIGLACAREMKTRGRRVFATARKPDNVKHLRDDVGVESLYLDYAEPASIKTAAEEVLAATGGKLAALFNNGAYGQPGAVEDLRLDVLRAQFEANVIGWHDLTVRLIPATRTQEALADSLRLELAATGIKSHSHRAGTHLFPLP